MTKSGEERDTPGRHIWPSMSNEGGNLPQAEQQAIRDIISELAEFVAIEAEKLGLSRFNFAFFRPFNAVFILGSELLFSVFSPLGGGIALLRYMDHRDKQRLTLTDVVRSTEQQLGFTKSVGFALPAQLLEQQPSQRQSQLEMIARNIVGEFQKEVDRQQRLIKLNPIFRTRDIEVEHDLCFVLIPFAPAFDRLYKEQIEPCVKEVGLRCLRADQIFSPTPIVEDIWVHICKSSVIIADVTGRNPNVFYELGIAHTVGKPVIVITQNKSDIPFDIAYIRYFVYSDDADGWAVLRHSVSEALKAIIAGRQP